VPVLFERWFRGERRLDARVAGDLSVSIHPQDLSDPIPGIARDLSMGGICVATRTPFACAGTLRIALHAPGPAICPEVRKLWQRYEPGEKAVLTGFAFERLSEDERNRISELVSASVQRIGEVLRSCRLPKLGAADLMRIAEAVRFRAFRAGHVIYGCMTRDRGAGSLFIIEKGGISLHLAGVESRSLALAEIQQGEIFGGIDLGPGSLLREVAIAEGDARLLEIGSSGMVRLRRQHPELALEIAGAAFQAASRRLCAALFEAAQPEPGLAARAGQPDV
jgi:hypothetical protein